MNKFSPYLLCAWVIFLVACTTQSETNTTEEAKAKTPVEVVSMDTGSVINELTLFGTSIYLKRNLVSAPIPAYITKVNVRLGDKVQKGEVLFVLESKERRALEKGLTSIDSTLTNFGKVQVFASSTGIISTLDQQQSGNYVLEGAQLCTIAESQDLVFQINVPYEYNSYTKAGSPCTIRLPDGTEFSATFTKALTTMNALAQTQSILAKSQHNIMLPEGLIVQALINKGTQKQQQVLPRSCVLSDEMMKEYWVMQLKNDSTAVKIPVVIGNKDNDQIEILSPQFESTARIISVGNYGLPDTAMVSTHKPVDQ